MLRVYCTGSINNKEGNVTVWDYLSYEPLVFLDLKDRKEAIKSINDLLECSDKEYIKKIMSLGVKRTHLPLERDKDREDWIKGAWMSVTNTIFNDLKIKAPNKPIEDIKNILELLDHEEQIKARESKRRLLKKKSTKRPLKKVTEPQDTTPNNIEPKVKKLKKKKKKRVK